MITEYRIPFPATLEEYRIGMLYTISRATEEENNRGDAQNQTIELISRQRFEDQQRGISGMYTEKRVKIRNRLPRFIKVLVPEQKCILVERAWNAFPHYCLTTYESAFFQKRFQLSIQSRYVENDRGGLHNALQLSHDELQQRRVVHVNLGSEQHLHMTRETDVLSFDSKRVKRARLDAAGEWIQRNEPVMCGYKVVRLNVCIPALPRGRVEQWCQRHAVLAAFIHYNRQVLCWMDHWYDLELDAMREMRETHHAQRAPARSSNARELADDDGGGARALLVFAMSDECNPFVT